MDQHHEPVAEPRPWRGPAWSPAGTRGPWPWLDWRYSLILPLAVLLLVGTLAYQAINQPDLLDIKVIDSTSGQPIAGARVSIGPQEYLTGADGVVRVDRPGGELTIRIQADGYQSVSGPFTSESDSSQRVPLPPAAGS